MTSPYRIGFYAPGDRGALEDLYQAVYGESWREHTRLDWYLDAPLAEAGSSVAVAGDTIVAAQPYCDLPIHTPWGTTSATLFLDVATHPAHRRQGLFRQVVTAARAAAFERGAALILTTPNPRAFQGFQTMPEWVHLCSLDCLLLPLGAGERTDRGGMMSLGAQGILAIASLLWERPSARLLHLAQSQYTTKSPWSPGPDADTLWREVASRANIMVLRDRAFLQWRFSADYQLFVARDSKGLTGYVATRVITRAGLKLGMILDCLMIGDGKSAVPLLTDALSWLREQGATAAIGYFLRYSAPWHQTRAVGFLRLPQPVTPRKYPVCASVQPEELHRMELLNPACWYMSLADSDLV